MLWRRGAGASGLVALGGESGAIGTAGLERGAQEGRPGRQPGPAGVQCDLPPRIGGFQ